MCLQNLNQSKYQQKLDKSQTKHTYRYVQLRNKPFFLLFIIVSSQPQGKIFNSFDFQNLPFFAKRIRHAQIEQLL